MRIYELAKQRECSSKIIMQILDEMKITYKTHSSSIPDDQLITVEKKLWEELNKPKPVEPPPEKLSKASKDVKSDKKSPHSGKDAKAHESSEQAKPKAKPQDKLKPLSLDKIPEAEPILPPEGLAVEFQDTDEESVDVETYEKVFEEIFEEEQHSKKKSNKPKHVKAKETTEPEIKDDSGVKQEIGKESPSSIQVPDGITVKDLSDASGIPASEIIKKLFLLGMMASINQNLDKDTILIVADEFKVNIEVKEQEAFKEGEKEAEPAEAQEVVEEELLEVRPPVVTIMGHVDHGKTTLLDTIRKTKVVDTESGGITQHIGAYMVEHKGQKICFIDTPGHAAFTSMRSMGANVTDIVVLVVAANDGIQPQTLESISHAREAQVPIIVAVNKIDMDNANIDKVKNDLALQNITPEDWGGENLFVNISAIKGIGIDQLLDAINLQAELLELKSNPKGKAFGIILESCQTNQLGPVATVLVKNGKLKVGDPVVSGHVYGKIRRIENDLGKTIQIASPSMPVKIFGFTEVPDIAARVKVYPSDREAKEAARKEEEQRRHTLLNKKDAITIENLYSSIQAETRKEFKAILKADVVGSIAAINSMLSSINSEKVKLKIIHSATGAVTDTDIMLAQAYGAIIFAFQVRTSPSALGMAKQHNVKIMEYSVIYKLYDDVVKAMEGLLDFDLIETATGASEVKKVFKVSKVGAVAGCLVIEGKVLRNSYARIKREGKYIDENKYKIASLKHFKDEASEIKMGTECGIALDNFSDFMEGDILEFHTIEKTASSL